VFDEATGASVGRVDVGSAAAAPIFEHNGSVWVPSCDATSRLVAVATTTLATGRGVALGVVASDYIDAGFNSVRYAAGTNAYRLPLSAVGLRCPPSRTFPTGPSGSLARRAGPGRRHERASPRDLDCLPRQQRLRPDDDDAGALDGDRGLT
jgi:hypothetical protein